MIFLRLVFVFWVKRKARSEEEGYFVSVFPFRDHSMKVMISLDDLILDLRLSLSFQFSLFCSRQVEKERESDLMTGNGCSH
jgi:hypothetical protein